MRCMYIDMYVIYIIYYMFFKKDLGMVLGGGGGFNGCGGFKEFLRVFFLTTCLPLTQGNDLMNTFQTG